MSKLNFDFPFKLFDMAPENHRLNFCLGSTIVASVPHKIQRALLSNSPGETEASLLAVIAVTFLLMWLT